MTERSWGACINTGLKGQVEEPGFAQVVTAGVATRLGVEPSARIACVPGSNGTLASVAMTDSSLEARANRISRALARRSATGTARQRIELLGKGGA